MSDKNIYTVPNDKALFKTKYPKKSASFSIATDILQDFDNYIKEANLKRSQTMEKLLVSFLENVEVRKKA